MPNSRLVSDRKDSAMAFDRSGILTAFPTWDTLHLRWGLGGPGAKRHPRRLGPVSVSVLSNLLKSTPLSRDFIASTEWIEKEKLRGAW